MSDTSPAGITLHQIPTNGVYANVATAGSGPAVVLLHGFPHTWQLWREIMGPLATDHRVIAPDLRGFGDSSRASNGYDAGTLATDIEGILDALDEPSAAVVAIDAGTPVAFLLAMRRPDRIRRLILMESLLGRLPGSEEFLAAGPPWWFGFHAVPGLAESVLTGNEAEYIDWFLQTGTRGNGAPQHIRDAFVDAYRQPEALRCAFDYYRALPISARQIENAVTTSRLAMPTLAIGAHPVGATLERQLRPVADDLTAHIIPDCGHIIPLDRPEELLRLAVPFFTSGDAPLFRSIPSTDATIGNAT